ncbi:MAG: 2-oxoacid oxidoreductase, beta subunit [Candidatus Kuenenbacteria bacterium GW2011_GWA2_42_15]|uniref:2-oxoacid oxidoreductase, beta subunit n=4 Tax=Candidatus Kueneniibacteriota TaxID=1752740 RepID=A0A0G0Z2H5_9BACT|nr:MAG: 2-oxoacid oxidoreductase, beta subunit [Candidatus Kuenenbacteria bacterium GW2011_GWA2_42_15]
MEKMGAEKFNTDFLPTWCPGCGNYGIWQALKQAFLELSLEPHQLFLVYDIGCFGNGANFIKTYVFHSLHGRTLPVALGAKIGNKDLTVIALAGDGGAYGEGVQHLLHTARYNIDITFLVANNQRFSLTAGQASPTTKEGTITKTTPFGEIKKPINPLVLSLEAGASFVARGFSGEPEHLKQIIKEAIIHKGFAHVDILQPCVSFNKENTYEWYRNVIYKLEEHRYAPHNQERALDKAREFELQGKLPIGVLYKGARETYEDKIPQLEGESLAKRGLKGIGVLA